MGKRPAPRRVKLSTIKRRLGIKASWWEEACKWQPRLTTVSKAGADGKVDEAKVVREIELAGWEPVGAAPGKELSVEEQVAAEKLEQSKLNTAILQKRDALMDLDLRRAQDKVVETEAIEQIGGGYIRKVSGLLNNMSSRMAPLLVGVKSESEAKQIIDDEVAKTLNEWRSWDVDKIAREARKSGTHRRSGNRSWRTENK